MPELVNGNFESSLLPEQNSGLPDTFRRLLKNKAALFGLSIIIILIISAIFASKLTPYEYDELVLSRMLLPPSVQHFMGTDDLGRDIFTRIVYGARISLQVGFIAVGLSLFLGTVLGAIAGYFGGVADYVISAFTDIAWGFPVTLLAIVFVAIMGPSLVSVMIAVAMVSWAGYARLVRGQFLSIREKDFVEAAHVLGMGNLRIIFRHILPNALAPIIVMTTLELPKAIIVEASLSFLGLGAQPPTPSWGSIISSGRGYILEAPWIVMFPGVMIMLVVLGFNLFGDALRDALDPRLKE